MIRLSALVLLITISFSTQAQRFEAGLAGGLNFTQLDGDRLSGYNKIGINGGFWVRYPFNDKWCGGIEFLFTQKGALRKIDSSNITSTYSFDKFRLNFIEVPLYAGYTYKKFTFQAGITGGYLISASTIDYVGKTDYKNRLKPFEMGTLWGVSYPITREISAQIRWQYSVFSLAKGDNSTIFTNNAFSKTILGLYNNMFGVSFKYEFSK